MGKTTMERSTRNQLQPHTKNNNNRIATIQRQQLLKHSTQPKNAKSSDSNCFSVNFIRYILQIYNVLLFVSNFIEFSEFPWLDLPRLTHAVPCLTVPCRAKYSYWMELWILRKPHLQNTHHMFDLIYVLLWPMWTANDEQNRLLIPFLDDETESSFVHFTKKVH